MTGQPDPAAADAYLDAAMRAIVLAKAALLGEASPGLFVSSSVAAEIREGLADAERGETEDLGSFAQYANGKHGRFDAKSEPALCQATTASLLPEEDEERHICDRPAGHGGWHKAADDTQWRELTGDYDPSPSPPAHENVRRFIGGLCPAAWCGDPPTMHCSKPSGHTGNHATTDPVIEWAGKWETAEVPPPRVMAEFRNATTGSPADGGWISGSCASWSDPDGAA